MQQFLRSLVRNVPVVALFAICPATPQTGVDRDDRAITLRAVSARPGMVSGGDVLVQVSLPPDLDASEFTLKRNGEDVTPAFRLQPQKRSLLGLVRGLKPGANTLQVYRSGAGTATAEWTVTNHPISGPVFSGPQEQPFICQTESFLLPDGKPLGPAVDANCSVDTVVTYVYRPASGSPGFVPLRDLNTLPADVAWTETSLGRKVPYVVRVETGTVNRAIYQVAVLHDPASEPEPSPFQKMNGWNGRLLYSFGGGCIGGWYRQGARMGGNGSPPEWSMLTDTIVGQGYAHASSSLNVFGSNCNDVIAAETMMMVKERFIETYGEPLFTFGRGGSGGAYQQIQIADNYPGLLDGIIPGATFPDVLATIQFLMDIQLLDRYFKTPDNKLRPDQKQAISGVGNVRTVASTAPGADRIKSPGICPPELPVSLRYHPVNNPSGARCNVFDHTANVYGRHPDTGFARHPIDNTGVQYGLQALRQGVIDVEEFLNLNERIGGYDIDGRYVPKRSEANREALVAAYATGRIAYGGLGLARVPIIDSRGYLDMKPEGDLHLKYHSFSLRERLRRANRTTANQVLLVTGPTNPPGYEAYTFAKMDEWLTNLHSDAAKSPLLERIRLARPADLFDSCYTASGERIMMEQTFTGGPCNELFPTYPSPRMIAGGPVTNDVLKCQLRPVDFAEYPMRFSDEQRTRLLSIFPNGVCDYTKAGVGQVAPRGSWLSY